VRTTARIAPRILRERSRPACRYGAPIGPIEQLKRVEHPVLRHVLLRARGALHAATNGHLARRRAVARYLASTDEPRLQIGAGPMALPGWLDSDLISGPVHLDLERPLPLPSERFAFVFGEHVIEHLSEAAGTALLAELHRILRPGGVVRLTTPDLAKIIALYEDRNPEISRDDYARFLGSLTGKRYERPAQILNDYLRLWGHRHVYDEPDLVARLREAGFDAVVRCEPGESTHAALRGIERHGGEPWVNRAEAMCLEATRAS
jgi:predicted SAM-dependent methyltransferase